MNWTQRDYERPNYWESEKFDFWIARKQLWNVEKQENSSRFVLFNGSYELGVYDTLQEAQNAAEPAHGVNEAPEDTPVCYWCGGIHLGEICKHAPYYVEAQGQVLCPWCGSRDHQRCLNDHFAFGNVEGA